uniref:CUB domain-containing protein n=1 Tax=Macrostomum lignano TaxID=282301 RepID=A0A1I8G0Q1_9PLAT
GASTRGFSTRCGRSTGAPPAAPGPGAQHQGRQHQGPAQGASTRGASTRGGAQGASTRGASTRGASKHQGRQHQGRSAPGRKQGAPAARGSTGHQHQGRQHQGASTRAPDQGFSSQGAPQPGRQHQGRQHQGRRPGAPSTRGQHQGRSTRGASTRGASHQGRQHQGTSPRASPGAPGAQHQGRQPGHQPGRSTRGLAPGRSTRGASTRAPAPGAPAPGRQHQGRQHQGRQHRGASTRAQHQGRAARGAQTRGPAPGAPSTGGQHQGRQHQGRTPGRQHPGAPVMRAGAKSSKITAAAGSSGCQLKQVAKSPATAESAQQTTAATRSATGSSMRPPGKRVIVRFTYMDLESPNDRVTLYDGLTTSSEIAVVSANDSVGYESPKFVSSANILTVNFYSNGQCTRKGFRLEYNATVSANSSACGPVTFDDASNSSGMIVSHPGYDQHSLYAASMSCSWTLPSVSGKFYQLFVGNVSLGNGDCLSVNQGTASVTGGSSNVNLCGWKAVTDMTLQVDGNFIIRFSSNEAYESTGFQIKFELVNYCYGFENVTATKTGGQIRSHYGVGSKQYLNNMSCYWYIRVPVGQRIAFRFTYFNTQTNDRVTVFDGSNASAVLFSTSGSNFKGVIVSSANTATVRFNTDSVNTGYGFAVWLQEIDSAVNNTCGTISYANSSNVSGVIESHKGYNATSMSAYAPNLACLWTLPKRPGFYIYLFIETYYLSNGDCLKMVTKLSSTASESGSDKDLQYCNTHFGQNVHWV